jgi:uncharacterized protein YdiU (UPF0061 family)
MTHKDQTTVTDKINHSEIGWRIEKTYARLPETLFSPAQPVPVRQPSLAILNERLASELGLQLERLSAAAVANLFAGHDLPVEMQPIAQAYAGHQFGSFTMLGDGRAILLGEQRTPAGKLVDIQLKGSGRTQFSRGGDGRAALGPMLREYLISEAMFGLGIPTTQSLAVVQTGEPVYRDTVRKGAILVRVAASHIRVGTFEYLAARRDHESLRALADYSIQRHYPEHADAAAPYQEFLRSVIQRQAALVAQWQRVGFIHGVMNTDNMAISGETIDYGPCAFMNRYDPDTVFSSIDYGGRYGYGNQPSIALWNLARFAEALLPLLAADSKQAIEIATGILQEYAGRFDDHWLAGMRRKLGLLTTEPGDRELIESLLGWMQKSRADFTNTFRALSAGSAFTHEPYSGSDFQAWYADWQQRLTREERPLESIFAEMRSVNPVVIPRNHRVEEALQAAEEQDDFTPLQRLLAAIQAPFDETAATAAYTEPPADECNYRTFCGT